MRTRRIAALGAVVVLAAACGTTVKSGSGHSGGSSSNGLSMPSGPSQNSPTNGSSPSGANSGSGGALAGSGSGSGSSGGGSYAVGSSGSGTGGPGVTSKFVGANAPGVTNQTMYVGVEYSSQSAQADRAIGAAGAAPSYDFRNVFNAAVNYANTHGGFAGRKLQPLYFDFNVTTDTNTQDQSACAYWTQDNKVFAIASEDPLQIACAEKAGAVPISAPAATEATFQQNPHLVDPEATALDRQGSVTVSGLYRAGYFSGKLGLVTWDDPAYRATISNGYLPALSSHHITPAQIAYISVPQQLGAVADMTAAVSSAVQKFKALGIDHVIVQDGHAGVWAGDGLTLEWMNQAKSQGYYPRYGMNSGNNPGASINPSDEMNKGLAVDDVDYDKQYDQGWHANPARDLCYQIEAAAGYPVSSSNANDEGLASQACDAVFFLQRVVNGITTTINNNSFVAQAQTLGTGFAPALVYGAKLFQGRRDGGDMFRTEEYLSSCSCLQYQGPPAYVD
ncbi:MAG TPA: hypothetical protein VFA11_00990 [Acidimicrobiales bacterium]|nr:hypothetical protein [Acidimicrobiales bacterium]